MLRVTRSPRAIALALLLAAGLVVATPLAASAHDRLVSSSPAAGAVLTEIPPQITLTFNAELMADAGTVVLDVLTSSGANVAVDLPLVQGVTVTRALSTDIAAGDYRVLWKVVSSDGHPISGEFAYIVDAAAIPVTPIETPTATPTAAPTAEPSATPSPTAIPDATPTSAGGQLVIALTIATAVFVGGGILVVLLVIMRKRRSTGAAR